METETTRIPNEIIYCPQQVQTYRDSSLLDKKGSQNVLRQQTKDDLLSISIIFFLCQMYQNDTTPTNLFGKKGISFTMNEFQNAMKLGDWIKSKCEDSLEKKLASPEQLEEIAQNPKEHFLSNFEDKLYRLAKLTHENTDMIIDDEGKKHIIKSFLKIIDKVVVTIGNKGKKTYSIELAQDCINSMYFKYSLPASNAIPLLTRTNATKLYLHLISFRNKIVEAIRYNKPIPKYNYSVNFVCNILETEVSDLDEKRQQIERAVIQINQADTKFNVSLKWGKYKSTGKYLNQPLFFFPENNITQIRTLEKEKYFEKTAEFFLKTMWDVHFMPSKQKKFSKREFYEHILIFKTKSNIPEWIVSGLVHAYNNVNKEPISNKDTKLLLILESVYVLCERAMKEISQEELDKIPNVTENIEAQPETQMNKLIPPPSMKEKPQAMTTLEFAKKKNIR